MEKARCDLIFSTMPLISTVPDSSKRLIHMSNVQNVPKQRFQLSTQIYSQYIEIVFNNIIIPVRPMPAEQ